LNCKISYDDDNNKNNDDDDDDDDDDAAAAAYAAAAAAADDDDDNDKHDDDEGTMMVLMGWKTKKEYLVIFWYLYLNIKILPERHLIINKYIAWKRKIKSYSITIL
jgi:hypothetical protein